MNYVSIDLETTGLDKNEHQIIEFGAIIEDTNNPKSYEDSKKYRRIILARDRKYVFSSKAAEINAGLIKTISLIENGGNPPLESDTNFTNTVLFLDQLIPDFKQWLYVNGFTPNTRGVLKIVAAGKNFASFDLQFLLAIPDFESYGIGFHHRSIEPGMAYIDWKKDTVPPGTDMCKIRAALPKAIKHDAISDAWDVIQMLRPQYNNSIDLRPVQGLVTKGDGDVW